MMYAYRVWACAGWGRGPRFGSVAGLLVLFLASAAPADGPPVFEVVLPVGSGPTGITAGPDGNLWFGEDGPKIGRITPAGTILCELPLSGAPVDLTAGPDANLWFLEYSPTVQKVGRINPALAGAACQMDPTVCIMEFDLAPGSLPVSIAAGPDGNLWFTEFLGHKIGRITPAGTIFPYYTTSGNLPTKITAGPDGNLWFTEYVNDAIARITPAGTITEFSVPAWGSEPDGLTAGPDGDLWFTIGSPDQTVGRMTPTGTVAEFALSAGSDPLEITAGPDGNLWFTENGGKIGRITPAGTVTEFPLSDGISPWTITAGTDDNIWFKESGDRGRIGRLQPNTGEAFVGAGTLDLSRNANTDAITGSINFQSDPNVRVFGRPVNLGGTLTLSGSFSGSSFALQAAASGCSCDTSLSCNSCGSSCTLCFTEMGTVSCPPAHGSCPVGGQRLTGTLTKITGTSVSGLPAGLIYKGDAASYQTVTNGLSSTRYQGSFALNAFQSFTPGVQTDSAPDMSLSVTAPDGTQLNGTVQVDVTYEGQCSNNTSVSCTSDANCGGGTCRGGVTAGQCSNDAAVSCTSDADCSGGTCASGTFVGLSPLPNGEQTDPNFTLQSKMCSGTTQGCEQDTDCVTYPSKCDLTKHCTGTGKTVGCTTASNCSVYTATCDSVYVAMPFEVGSTADTAGKKKVCLHYSCENMYTSVKTNPKAIQNPVLPGKYYVCRDNLYTNGNDFVFQRFDQNASSYYVTEKSLYILHKDPTSGMFVDVTSSRDWTTNVICAETTSLSPFLLAMSSTIPGGGSVKTDCISEWNAGSIATFDRTGVTKNRVVCHDGNPCDAGGATPDGQCIFTISVCPNVMDSRLPACTPTDVAAYTLAAPLPDARNTTDAANAAVILSGLEGLGTNAVSGRHHNVVTYTTPVAATGCATGIPITVPVRVDRFGVPHPGSKVISLKAVTSGKVTDSDLLTLVCQP